MKKVIVAVLIILTVLLVGCTENNGNTLPVPQEAEYELGEGEITTEPLTDDIIDAFQTLLRTVNVHFDNIDNKYEIYFVSSILDEVMVGTQINAFKDGGLNFPTISTHYVGEGWIFFNEITFAMGEERIVISDIPLINVSTRVISGNLVRESYTITTSDTVAILQHIAETRDATIRLRGDRIVDRTLTVPEVNSLRFMLQIFEKLYQHPGLVNYITTN